MNEKYFHYRGQSPIYDSITKKYSQLCCYLPPQFKKVKSSLKFFFPDIVQSIKAIVFHNIPYKKVESKSKCKIYILYN